MASTECETVARRRHAASGDAQTTKRREPQLETCRLCAGTNVDEIVEAGGDIGWVHRSCFIEWDHRQEALEMAACVGFLDDPGEFWVELEMDGAPLARAA